MTMRMQTEKKRKRLKKQSEGREQGETWGHLYGSMEIVILATLWQEGIKWTLVALTFAHSYSLILAILIFFELYLKSHLIISCDHPSFLSIIFL